MLFRKSGGTTEVVQWTVSNRTVIRVLALVIASFLFVLFLRKTSHALILIFTAFFLALALNAPVHLLAQHLPGRLRGKRALATTISFLIVVILLGAFLFSLVPPLVRQTSAFISVAPHLLSQTRDQQNAVGNFVRRHNLQHDLDSVSKQLSGRLGAISGSAVSSVEKIGSSIFSMLVVLALTFMMLSEGQRWLELIDQLVPSHHRAHSKKLAHDMYLVVKGYVNGQVVLAIIAACLVLPAMLVLHISYPIALMVVVFICGLIPMVGHTIGAVIVTTVALFHSLPAAAAILAYYIFYQQVENYVIQPQIQANTTNLSPLLVFGSVIVGVNFGGLLGGLVAIPAVGCLRVLVLDYLQANGRLHTAKSNVPSTVESK